MADGNFNGTATQSTASGNTHPPSVLSMALAAMRAPDTTPGTSLQQTFANRDTAFPAVGAAPGSPSALGRRRRSHNGDESDDEDEEGVDNLDAPSGNATPASGSTASTSSSPHSSLLTPPSPSTITNHNAIAFASQYSRRKRLRGEYEQALQEFAGDAPLTREIKIFAHILTVEQELKKIVTTTPPFVVSKALKKNIRTYSVAVLLSPKIKSYKGDAVTNIVLNIIKRYRFDVPLGIEHNAADWGTIVTAVRDGLTQLRSDIKKLIIESMPANRPRTAHMNIYTLTNKMLFNTAPMGPTVHQCARVAFMRAMYEAHADAGDKYWDELDNELATIFEEAHGNHQAFTRAFQAVLEHDRSNHGVRASYEIREDVFNETQEDVDGFVTNSQ
ncbi:hypothetical protein K474DRAFT_1704644 [Panus rudis PR-1116 ss-1]|nr:hypothetical protein K474DRAFT_1704644 [Panus rudis PR-1116 ss-1]